MIMRAASHGRRDASDGPARRVAAAVSTAAITTPSAGIAFPQCASRFFCSLNHGIVAHNPMAGAAAHHALRGRAAAAIRTSAIATSPNGKFTSCERTTEPARDSFPGYVVRLAGVDPAVRRDQAQGDEAPQRPRGEGLTLRRAARHYSRDSRSASATYA
jgi:hypothetical protein